MSLYITSSKGLFKYNLKKNTIKKIIGIKHKGIFKRPSKGFFGICFNSKDKQIISASRENISKNISYEKTTDVILHFYDPVNDNNIKKTIINDLLDVHQICYFNNKIYLTETGRNRIQVYNCENNKVEKFINIGSIRKNLNHLNSVCISENELLIGLNNGNKGNLKNSQIVKLTIDEINNSLDEIDAFQIGKITNLKNIYHTHDIEKNNDDYLISASEDGNLISFKSLKILKNLPIWTRGISISKNNIFVGKSGIATRKLRHSRYYDGKVSVLDKSTLKILRVLNIPKIGQLNDILYHEF